MNEGAALRVLSFLNDTNERHLASLANEKRKVTVIGEEHEPDELQEKPSSTVNNEEEALLTPEQIKEFFKATEDGSVEQLDNLFDTIANVDPNMTHFTESLLMTAIRGKRRKVAEYLIDQLAVNVNNTTDFIEFRGNAKFPIRRRTLKCRDLAYDKGMMDLVDLIDIVSDDVKPSIKRYLQRRLKVRLDEIHQAYLKRMNERSHRLTIPSQQKEDHLLENEEQDTEESSSVNITDGNNLPPPPLSPPLPSAVHRSYKSHIAETIENIESNNDKSIDESGKKTFRYSGYTLRFRLVETLDTNQQTYEQRRSRPTTFSLPFIPSTTTGPLPPSSARPLPPSSARPLPPPSARPLPPSSARPVTTSSARPVTTSTATNMNRRSISEINARTSLDRSARRVATARVVSTVNSENKPEVKLTVPTTINTTQRLLPKRIHQTNRNYGYIPQLQYTLYNDLRRSMPVTLKATATGLTSGTRLIRD